MNLFRSLQTALSNLRANKLRSLLTMLGVIIGVSGVIVMVAIVEGARSRVVGEFERLGSKLIIIAYQLNAKEERTTTRRIKGLTMDDVRAIREECDLVQGISAEIGGGAEEVIHYRNRESKGKPNGIMPDYARLRNVTVVNGRFITDADLTTWSKVGVIGSKIKAELFPNDDPLGQTISIRGLNVTVVGVLAPKGKSGGEDADRAILTPITMMQKRVIGQEIVGMVWAQPKDVSQVNATMDQIWKCLMRRHDNAPGIRVDSQENILNAIGRILNIFGMVLGSVAGLALLVGGIGVMNIMLVSVTERTREIGLRKAVGATRKDIMIQFLIEAATVTGVGGLIGIALGAGVSQAIGAITRQFIKGGPNNAAGLAIHLPMWAVLGAFGFSASIGLFFGLYPAVRAARLDPIEALRHE